MTGRTRPAVSVVVGTFAVVAASLLATSCSHMSAHASSGAGGGQQATAIDEHNDPNLVRLSNGVQFALVSAETRRAPMELQVNGTITPDVSKNVPVTALASGRVVEIDARLGDEVRKGQPLLKIHSPDLAQAIGDYRKFAADEVLAHQQYDRSKLLYDHGALAMKDLQTADDAWQKAKVDVQTAAERIHLLGGDLNALQPVIELRAPASGTIIEQNVTNTAAVKSPDNSPNLFTIADLSHVWLLCDVYEDNLADVHLGDWVEVHLNAYPDRVLRGRVGNISSLLDPATRTAKVRVEMTNPGGLLRPGMFAKAVLRSQTTQPFVVVPSSAIFRLHDKDWVFMPAGNGAFRRTEVQTGSTNEDSTIRVLDGLRQGDSVAANALQLSAAGNEEKQD